MWVKNWLNIIVVIVCIIRIFLWTYQKDFVVYPVTTKILHTKVYQVNVNALSEATFNTPFVLPADNT